MRVIVQGPRPTTPVISVAPVASSGSQLDITLVSPSTGPAPPYSYELQEALSQSGPWTTLASGAVFTGGVFQRNGLQELETRFYRLRAFDSASPQRASNFSSIVNASTFDVTPADPMFITAGDVTDWPRLTPILSQVLCHGVNTTVPFSATVSAGTNLRWRVNGGPFTSTPVMVQALDNIDVEFTTPNTFSTVCTLTISMGSRQSSRNITTVAQAGANLIWPAQASGNRTHAIPAINMWGSDNFGGGGRHPSSPGVDIILVNNLANSNTVSAVGGLGAGVYEGTAEGALRMNNGGRSKLIIDTRSGVTNAAKIINIAPVTGGFSWWGQFAPFPGHYMRGLVPRTIDCRHFQIWHKSFYVGDDGFGVSLDNRDCFSVGDAQNYFFVNCEFGWSIDEVVDGFNPTGNGGFIYCAFIEPMHVSLHPDIPGDAPEHGFGPLLGSQQPTFPLSIERCFFAHITDRMPWIGVQRATLANCINYNNGRWPSGDGIGVRFMNRGHSGPGEYNVVGYMFVRGPDSGNSLVAIRAVQESVSWQSGSGVHIAGCAQNGWSTPSSQSGYLQSAPSPFQFFSTGRANALPQGRLTNFSDVFHMAANQNAPTQQEKLGFFNLIKQSVGPNPELRTTQYGRLATALAQCEARLNGDLSSTRQYVNCVADDGSSRCDLNAGGWWSVPDVTVNPLNPGSHWHAPLPTTGDRHTPYADGFFSNGLSRAGYTPMEVWAIEQHWFRGGK